MNIANEINTHEGLVDLLQVINETRNTMEMNPRIHFGSNCNQPCDTGSQGVDIKSHMSTCTRLQLMVNTIDIIAAFIVYCIVASFIYISNSLQCSFRYSNIELSPTLLLNFVSKLVIFHSLKTFKCHQFLCEKTHETFHD